MKKVLLIATTLLLTTLAFAQKNLRDVLYLKNGSIIRGNVIEIIPNEKVKIETTDKSLFIYNMSEVEKITKEEIPARESSKPKFSYSGYQLMLEIGMAEDVDYDFHYTKFSVINSYRFNPYVSLGIGTGIRAYVNQDIVGVPIFADFRWNIIKKRVTPYVSLGAGYLLNGSNNLEGIGAIVMPAVGVKFRFTKNIGLNLGISYDLTGGMRPDESYYNWNSGNYYYDNSKVVINAISFNAGVSF